MTVESVTQAVSNLALQFGEEDADPGAMVSRCLCQLYSACTSLAIGLPSYSAIKVLILL